MKYITFAVPCYNSAPYMKKCIDSLLPGGELVEIIIVNDGSTDSTSEIAHAYEAAHPGLVRVIDQPNGGHGAGVNAGLREAEGLYYKVVDSDDWLDGAALKTLLETIGRHRAAGTLPDLYIANFVYEKVSAGTRFVRSFRKNFPEKEFFGWEDVRKFRISSVLLMHSLIYRTENLRASGTVLPEHTFYVDNIFAYKPLPYMKKLCYLDIDLYRYFIGREDQSVSESNIVKRYSQQIRVMKAMIDCYGYEGLRSFSRGLKRYMLHDLAVAMTLTVMFTTGGRDEPEKRKAALREIWEYIRKKDIRLYRFLRYRSYPALVGWLPFRMQGKVTVLGYRYFRAKLKCS